MEDHSTFDGIFLGSVKLLVLVWVLVGQRLIMLLHLVSVYVYCLYRFVVFLSELGFVLFK